MTGGDGVLMRVPSGGGLLDWLTTSQVMPSPGGDAVVGDVSDWDLNRAVDALRDGWIEYVGLELGPRFVQAAGEGEGPYELERSEDAGEVILRVPAGVDLDTVRRVLTRFREQDPRWWEGPDWVMLHPRARRGDDDEEPRPNRLRRLFRRQ